MYFRRAGRQTSIEQARGGSTTGALATGGLSSAGGPNAMAALATAAGGGVTPSGLNSAGSEAAKQPRHHFASRNPSNSSGSSSASSNLRPEFQAGPTSSTPSDARTTAQFAYGTERISVIKRQQKQADDYELQYELRPRRRTEESKQENVAPNKQQQQEVSGKMAKVSERLAGASNQTGESLMGALSGASGDDLASAAKLHQTSPTPISQFQQDQLTAAARFKTRDLSYVDDGIR